MKTYLLIYHLFGHGWGGHPVQVEMASQEVCEQAAKIVEARFKGYLSLGAFAFCFEKLGQ